jgi:hypothetical protein
MYAESTTVDFKYRTPHHIPTIADKNTAHSAAAEGDDIMALHSQLGNQSPAHSPHAPNDEGKGCTPSTCFCFTNVLDQYFILVSLDIQNRQFLHLFRRRGDFFLYKSPAGGDRGGSNKTVNVVFYQFELDSRCCFLRTFKSIFTYSRSRQGEL